MEIVIDDQGLRGVEIFDQNPGQYRFKRGVAVAAPGQSERYDDERIATEPGEQLVANHAPAWQQRCGADVSTASASSSTSLPMQAFAAASGDIAMPCRTLLQICIDV